MTFTFLGLLYKWDLLYFFTSRISKYKEKQLKQVVRVVVEHFKFTL